MAIFSIVKTRKPRQFQYNPRYYNARAERLDAIVRRARAERDGVPPEGGGAPGADLRLSFEEANFVRALRRERRRSRLMLGLLLLAIILLIYLWL